MAALGKILGKGSSKQHSVYTTAQYEKLNQDASENEEDEVVFVHDALITQQNGVAHSKKKPIENLSSAEEAIEMGLLQKAKVSRTKPKSEVEVKGLKRRGFLSCLQMTCIVLTLLILCGVALAVIIGLPYFTSLPKKHQQTPGWNLTLEDYATESCIRLVDVDKDGKPDIIFSLSQGSQFERIAGYDTQAMKDFCKEIGEAYPCVGIIVALRGYDGKELWRLKVKGPAFEINCEGPDINKDGHKDCLAAGRVSTSVAFNPLNGHILWTAEESALESSWNTYNMLVLPDLTGDGVEELILANGGDPKFPPQVHNRYPGRLILLDGATGRSLGQHLAMPEKRETYMSPVLHRRKDGSLFVLFGTGGETISGSLFAISVLDFYRHVKKDKSLTVPGLKANLGTWTNFIADELKENKIVEIYKSKDKGVMVPVVLVDVDNDGVKDILMTAYDGIIILFNGETLHKQWVNDEFKGFESYSTPAPGYFNNDTVLDFMLHTNLGGWPHYNYSVAVILDGKTGKQLWSLKSPRMEMSSGLVLRTNQENRDAFLFRIQGLYNVHDTAPGPPAGGKTAKVKRATYDDPYDEQNPLNKYPEYGVLDRGRLNSLASQYAADRGYNRRGPYRPLDDYTGTIQGQRPQYEQAGASVNKPYARAGSFGQLGGLYRPASRQNTRYGGLVGRRNDLLQSLHGDENQPDDLGDYIDPNDPEGRFTSLAIDDEYNRKNRDDAEDNEEETDDDEEEAPAICDSDISLLTTRVFLMDRTTFSQPILIAESPAEKYIYNLTDEDRKMQHENEKKLMLEDDVETTHQHRPKRHGDHGSDHLSAGGQNDINFCSLLKNVERLTGAIGDVDGDGTLDFIALFGQEAMMMDRGGSYVTSKRVLRLVKINMAQLLGDKQKSIPLSVEASQEIRRFPSEIKLADINFLSADQQLWTEYLGTYDDSVYEPNRS